MPEFEKRTAENSAANVGVIKMELYARGPKWWNAKLIDVFGLWSGNEKGKVI